MALLCGNINCAGISTVTLKSSDQAATAGPTGQQLKQGQ